MSDPRIEKLAKVLVRYSLDLQPGDQFAIQTNPLTEPLSLAVYKEAVLAGAHVTVMNQLPGAAELFLKHASDEQLAHVSPLSRLVVETFDAMLHLGANYNTRALSGVDPARRSQARRASADLQTTAMKRSATGDLKWCYTVFPAQADAQEADMSLSEYEDFIYGAGLLDQEDPVAGWLAEAERQRKLIKWLAGRDQVVLRGRDIDLRLSIKDRPFIEAAGRENFPDGEIFTSPVEESVNGWVRFAYPAIYGGQEVVDIELWFEEGKIVKEKATKGQELLTALLDTDDGSRTLGEWGIGTNYGIQRFTKHMLFDEKMGGTIHLAVGAGFPEANSQNNSGLHWDMLCNMAESEVLVDGELFYQNGQFAPGLLD